MLSLLSDRDDFALGSALLGVAAAILTVATASSWGVLALAPLVPLMASFATRWAPPAWLALPAAAAAVVPTEAAGTGNSGYFVIVVLLLILAARGFRRVEYVLVVGVVLSPVALWAVRVPDYVEFGPWTWTSGLLLGWLFGAVVHRLWDLIDELQATREQLAEAAADRERQRIAREMHDVVGHSFSVVLLHLAGARTMLEADRAGAVDALRSAEEVGRRGMDDLRQTIGLLRSGEAVDRRSHEVGDVAALVAEYRDAGLSVDARLDDGLDDVGGAARLVTGDVVRESLTNAAKHAAGEVRVTVALQPDRVDVRLDNPARASAQVGDGSGIAGMRQRVEALGGCFDAGLVDGRWVVRASVPRGVDRSAVGSVGVER